MTRYPALSISVPATRQRFPLLAPLLFGLAFNFISIVIGNPYLIALAGLIIACVATVAWANRPLQWIVLALTLAANPVNLSATIAVNLFFGVAFIMLNMNYLDRLPGWLLVVNILFLISVVGSVFNWTDGISPASFFHQGAAVANYFLGPFLLIAGVHVRLREVHDYEMVLKVFVFALILPTVLLIALAYGIGRPVSDYAPNLGYLVNVSVYRLGNVDFQLTRTQVGIVLAALACSSFAVVINNVTLAVRLTGGACLAACGFLFLVTGSVWSVLAAFLGIAVILVVARRYLLVGLLCIGLFYAAWGFLPEGIRAYSGSRYEQRFVGGGVDVSDRTSRWRDAFNYLIDNPLGVGWSLWIEPIDTYPHNDYLSYAIAFGFMCGLLYIYVPAKVLYSLLKYNSPNLQPPRLAIVLAGIGVIVAFLLNSFSDHLTANRWYFNVVWSIIWFVFFASSEAQASVSAGAEA